MDNLLKEKKGVGVIVCRMQVPYLTKSHKSMIKTVLNRHSRVIMFLGTTNKTIDNDNPYPFEFRKQMVEQEFKLDTEFISKYRQSFSLTVVPLPDIANDNPLWVKILDSMIGAFLSFDENAVLYGGRDSFIPYYEKDNGKHKCVELAAVDYDSGTELRKLTAIKLPKYSIDAANAILWTLRQTEK